MFKELLALLLGNKEPAAQNKEAGFFSTDANFQLGKYKTENQLAEIIKRSMQRTPADFKAVDESGNPVAGETIAMDDAGASDSCKPYTNLQSIMPINQIGWYSSMGFIGYQLCSIIAQHWLVKKACEMPGRDAMRHGYEISLSDGNKSDSEFIAKLKKLDRQYKIKKQAVEFIAMGRVFGIRIALPVVDYGSPELTRKALGEPFNIDGVKRNSYKGIKQIDPYWITPELDQAAAVNPASLHFYEPTWWRVNGVRIHRSHLIIFKTCEVADILKPTYFYGGIPLTQMIAERIYAAERVANEAPMLSLSKRTTVIHADLEAAIANQASFEERMKQWAYFRDNYGIKVLGKAETAEQFDTSLTDLDVTIMTQYQLVAAIAGVPAVKLLETSPKGFNATGEFESKGYQEDLESIQENDIEPLIERHHMLAMKSEFGSITELSIVWNPVVALSAKEIAEVNKIKAETGMSLVNSGAIDGDDERERIIADEASGYNGLTSGAPTIEEEPTENENGTN